MKKSICQIFIKITVGKSNGRNIKEREAFYVLQSCCVDCGDIRFQPRFQTVFVKDLTYGFLNAYAQGDQKLYIELEDRFMKPSKIASRRQFMETVIAWAFIFFYLQIRRDHRYFTALSFLLSSHTLLSYVNRFEFILSFNEVQKHSPFRLVKD